jgi:thiamine pyrophosphokinase
MTVKNTLEFVELEQVYDLLAQAIDKVGKDNEALFLGKLCITLAHRVGELDSVKDSIRIAAKQF